MISVSKALSILSDHVPEGHSEIVALQDALGRISAKDMRASVTRPPHDISAMDGYAVRLEDVRKQGARLTVIGDVPAGSVFDGAVGKGEAVRLFTGSPIPEGADHVIIQENTTREGGFVKINISSNKAQYIRPAGLDFAFDDILVPRFTQMGPIEIALVAAGNTSEMSVLNKPRIAILAAGDELVSPGKAADSGDIVNSNTSALSALIHKWGGTAIDMGLTKDDPGAIRDMFTRASDCDIILPVGGASVGDHDHMRHVFNKLSGQILFETVAVKPGKPTWFGLLAGTPVLGLPGNPASALVCACLFLRALMGYSESACGKARLEIDLQSNGPRETYLRARVSCRDGQLFVSPLPHQDSSLLMPFRRANVLLKRAPNAASVRAGELVDVIDFGAGPHFLAQA